MAVIALCFVAKHCHKVTFSAMQWALLFTLNRSWRPKKELCAKMNRLRRGDLLIFDLWKAAVALINSCVEEVTLMLYVYLRNIGVRVDQDQTNG